jgi:TPR repeat protein
MAFSFFRLWFGTPLASAETIIPGQTVPGRAEEEFRKGLKFASGQGENQDYAKAAQCYAESAELNHGLAQYNLAVMYGQGQGVARDETKWLMWMTRSAELGDAGAQYQLGVHQHATNRDGREPALPEGRIEALKWARLSAAQGYRGAENACEFITMEMSREEVHEGGRRAAAFVAGKGA